MRGSFGAFQDNDNTVDFERMVFSILNGSFTVYHFGGGAKQWFRAFSGKGDLNALNFSKTVV